MIATPSSHWALSLFTVFFISAPPAMADTAAERHRLALKRAQQLAVARAGLGPAPLAGLSRRQRWAAAMPSLRFEVVRAIERDGRATVRLDGAAWSGDVTAVDDRGDGLRLKAELRWSPGGLFHAPGELSVRREQRATATARRALVAEVTEAWFTWLEARRLFSAGEAEVSLLRIAAAHLEHLIGEPPAGLLGGAERLDEVRHAR